MDPIDKSRFFNMAEAHDQMCRTLVPGYDFMQGELIRILRHKGVAGPVIVELGAGSGIFASRLLDVYPDSRYYWVDYSDDFLRVARHRLAPFAERVSFIQIHAGSG